ncbi:unnamed protein product [Rhodiola kirilowii]
MAGARAAAQAMKRVPRIKFPQRHSNPSDSAAGETNELQKIFYPDLGKSTEVSWGGKVSLQPKRTPMSAEEMEAILLGGCF